jgi:hypothetical protein
MGIIDLAFREIGRRIDLLDLFGGEILDRVRRQKALCFQRRHASLAGSGDGLTVDVVGHVAGGEYARNRCRGRIWRGLDVAPLLHL